MVKARPRTIGRAILLVAGLACLGGCERARVNSASPPPPGVVVADVRQRDEPIRQEWIGSLDGLVNAQIRAEVAGYLLRQDYADGAWVKKGDLLFEIDPRTFQASYAQAKAVFDRAQLDFNRASTLLEKKVASIEERDNAQQALTSATAALDQAKLNLEFTRITSPIDGIAGIASAQIGDLVGPGSGLLTTVSTIDPIKVYFSISEQSYLEFSRAPAGQPRFPQEVEFELITSDGRVYPRHGKFLAMDREVDPATGTLRIAATFPNPDRLLRPGQYGRVRAVVRTVKDALLIPQRAVSELQGVYQVTVVDGGNVAHVRTVKLGPEVGSWWIVEQGLKPHERVIVEGMQKAREGTRVSPQTDTQEVVSRGVTRAAETPPDPARR